MFDYDVFSKEMADKHRFSLLDEGKYQGVITHCEARMTRTNKWMFEMMVDVYDKSGMPFPIKTFLVFQPNMMWKIINCCESTGTLDEYNNKTLNNKTFVGKPCVVDVKIESGRAIPDDKLNGKEPGSTYPSKNVINDFLVDKTFNMSNNASINNVPLNDDIPF